MISNYRRGADKERRIVNAAIKRGCLAFRSAGSHSKFDYVILDFRNHKVIFGQSKIGKSYDNLKDGTPNSIMRPLLEEFDNLNKQAEGVDFKVEFEVR